MLYNMMYVSSIDKDKKRNFPTIFSLPVVFMQEEHSLIKLDKAPLIEVC